MARRKKPKNETPEEIIIRQCLEVVANASTRSEKTSWNRKMDNMVKLIAILRPVEEQIIELIAQKMPVMDHISKLRSEMIKECIHPIDDLVYKETHIECKFCTSKIGVPNGREKV